MTDLSYSKYLKIDELLSLQKPLSEPAHHDETLFIVIHQAYELWFKQLLHECRRARATLDDRELGRAAHYLRRCEAIFKLLLQQIHILETFEPIEFLEFRDRLNPASGFQSPQFRELEFLFGMKDPKFLKFFEGSSLKKLESALKEKDLATAFEELLLKEIPVSAPTPEDRVFQSLTKLYQNSDEHLGLYLIAESLITLDQCFTLWREHHVQVVERVIGNKPGTGGSTGVEYLKSTMTKRAFPKLWKVRTLLQRRDRMASSVATRDLRLT